MPPPKQSRSHSGKLLGTVSDRARNRKADAALLIDFVMTTTDSADTKDDHI